MFLLFFALLNFCAFAAKPEIPLLKNWATDFTNTLSKTELQQLNFRLKTYQDTTTNQLVSLIIATLDGYPLEEYSFEVAEKNNIGTKENSNGVLFLVVKNDRKMRIEVGYGLEGALPDALASSIIRNEVAPYFRRDEYFAGINSGIDAIIAAIGGEYKADLSEKSDEESFPGLLFFLIILFIVLAYIPRLNRPFGPGGFTYRGGTWGGGSFGGPFGSSGSSGFGGFSGGGGSFGGGGASGSW